MKKITVIVVPNPPEDLVECTIQPSLIQLWPPPRSATIAKADPNVEEVSFHHTILPSETVRYAEVSQEKSSETATSTVETDKEPFVGHGHEHNNRLNFSPLQLETIVDDHQDIDLSLFLDVIITEGESTNAEPQPGQVTKSPLKRKRSEEDDGNTATATRVQTDIETEIEAFARLFKRRRTELKMPSTFVSTSLDHAYGVAPGTNLVQPASIQKFEANKLSSETMSDIYGLLKNWIEKVNPENPSANTPLALDEEETAVLNQRMNNRILRTPIRQEARYILEQYFHENPKPDERTMAIVSEYLELSPEKVKNWFNNRRSKMKKNANGDDLDNPEPEVACLTIA